jgi:hypothetical protein
LVILNEKCEVTIIILYECVMDIEMAYIMHRHPLKTHSIVFIVHNDKPNGQSFTYGVEN